MKQIYLSFLYLFFISSALAQNSYKVDDQIPKELLPRASAVVRFMETNIEVKAIDQVVYKFKQVITVLNKNGDDHAAIKIWYNKAQQIKAFRGTIYDKLGNPLSKLSIKELIDESAVSSSSLFEDSRIKSFKPNAHSYPYTLEYEYEIRSNQTLNFPNWYPNNAPGVAVEYAALKFSSKPDFSIRYKENNYPGKIQIYTDDKLKTYHWEVKALKAFRYEPYSPLPETFLISVNIAPDSFSYQGIKGSFTNWEEYGKWMYEALLKGRDQIPEATAAHIRSITDNITDPKEKAKKIYEYMQQKTRYVSIQIGIGGYQPFLASEVDRTGYGDCKALVNYTQGLLKVAGIESLYVVVASGDKKQDAILDFASMNQFDHVILAIPFKGDTIWTDCTNREVPFGYVSDFIDDRLVVACTSEGGKLLRTPKFDELSNLQSRKAYFLLDSVGTISKGSIKTVFTGWQYKNRIKLVGEPITEQLKRVPKIYGINDINIESYKLSQKKSREPIMVEQIELSAPKYGVLNFDLMFFPINRVNRTYRQKEIKNRENKVYINRGFVDIDSVVFKLPKKYKIEHLPKSVSLDYPFGTFSMDIKTKKDSILYIRKVHVKQGTYPVAQYANLVKFYEEIRQADFKRAVLKK